MNGNHYQKVLVDVFTRQENYSTEGTIVYEWIVENKKKLAISLFVIAIYGDEIPEINLNSFDIITNFRFPIGLREYEIELFINSITINFISKIIEINIDIF